MYVIRRTRQWNDALTLAYHFSENLQNYGVLLVAWTYLSHACYKNKNQNEIV